MFSYVTLLIYLYISYTAAVSPNMWGKRQRSALFYKAFITSTIGSCFMTFEHLHTTAAASVPRGWFEVFKK